MSRPRRIDNFSYLGPHRYFVTCCTRNRARAFTDAHVVDETTMQIRRTCDDQHFALLVYCFMPDHLHLLVEGMTATSDLLRFAKMAKQRSGSQYALTHGQPLWQEGYYERVLRMDDDTRRIARYILANPVRGGLVEDPRRYVFSGSDRWTIDEILEGVREECQTTGSKGPDLRTGSKKERPTCVGVFFFDV